MRRINYVDTFDVLKVYTKESFVDYCTGCETEYDAESEADWLEWATYESESDIDAFIENVRYLYFDKPVVVDGNLGLWDGRKEVEQTYFDNPIDAVYACINNANAVIIDKVGNHIEIISLHHDGRNYFTLTFLNGTGEDRFKRNGKVSVNNRENVFKLPKYLY